METNTRIQNLRMDLIVGWIRNSSLQSRNLNEMYIIQMKYIVIHVCPSLNFEHIKIFLRNYLTICPKSGGEHLKWWEYCEPHCFCLFVSEHSIIIVFLMSIYQTNWEFCFELKLMASGLRGSYPRAGLRRSYGNNVLNLLKFSSFLNM